MQTISTNSFLLENFSSLSYTLDRNIPNSYFSVTVRIITHHGNSPKTSKLLFSLKQLHLNSLQKQYIFSFGVPLHGNNTEGTNGTCQLNI